jgi:hypothetical protein
LFISESATFGNVTGKSTSRNFFLRAKLPFFNTPLTMARLAAKPAKVYQQSSDEEEYENEFHEFDNEEEVI